MSSNDQFSGLLSDGKPVVAQTELSGLEGLLADFSSCILPGCWIFLNGDLGTGKTTFTQILLRQLGYTKPVASPTFSILNVMDLDGTSSALSRICHLDLYRLKNAAELCHLGLELEFRQGAVCIFEWAENIDSDGWSRFFKFTGCKMPRTVITVSISRKAEGSFRTYEFAAQNAKDAFGF
jgi:tRNA threonylcarbamoyl adenosine modification protein YjeE